MFKTFTWAKWNHSETKKNKTRRKTNKGLCLVWFKMKFHLVMKGEIIWVKRYERKVSEKKR